MDSTDALPVSPPVASSSLADVYAYMSSSVAAADSSDSDSSHHSDISKRPASPDFLDGPDRKRLRDTSLPDQDHDMPDACSSIDKHSPRASSSSHPGSGGAVSPSADAQAIIDDLGQELECGCCSALVYRPVIVNPCQHFFCGSCCVLWIKNGGTNCPACRSASVVVCPSRALQAMVDVLLRAAPHLGRTPRERAQADELYPLGRSLRIPVPREPSPAPNLNIPVDFVRPCPHCNPSNSYGWTCPDPVPEPDNNSGWRLEDGTPHGHGYCGNCEGLLALAAPTTSKCDFCQVSFCGINIHGRCSTSTLYEQRPQDMSDVTDLIQSPEVYDCFDGVTTEVERMLDYLREGEIRPIQIYRDIIDYIQENPPHFAPLIEQELFAELYSVGAGDDPDPTAPRNRICRLCAKEVLLYGLKDWWERVRTFELSSAGVQDSQADDTQSLMTDSQMSESEVGRGLQNSDTSAESTSTTPPIPFAEQPSIALPPRLPSLAELGFATSFPYTPSSLRRTPSGQEQRSSSSSSMVDLSNYVAATSSNPSNSMNATNTSTQMSPAASQDAVEAMLSAEEARFSVFARALRRKMPDEMGEEMNQLQRHISFTNHSSNSNDNETNSTDNSNTTDYSSSSHSSVLGSETSGQLDFHSNMSEEARDRDRERRLEVLFGTSGDNAIPGPIVAGGIGGGVGSSRLNPFNIPSTNYLPLPLIRPPIMDNGMGSGMSMGMDD